MSRRQPRRAPVGLRPGDEFATPFGPVEIAAADGDDYLVHDPRTGEETWLDVDDLVAIMSARCWTYPEP